MTGNEKTGDFFLFASSTTGHGFSKVANSESRLRQSVWCFLIICAWVGVFATLSVSIATYLEFGTVTETTVEANKTLNFPAITICNINNLYSSSAEEFLNSRGIQIKPNSELLKTALHNDPGLYINLYSCLLAPNCLKGFFSCPTVEIGCCLPEAKVCDGFTDCRDGTDENNCGDNGQARGNDSSYAISIVGARPDLENDLDFSEVVLNLGWKLVDRQLSEAARLPPTLLKCRFGKQECNSEWFEEKLTDSGRCYTFNGYNRNLNTGSSAEPLQQYTPGAKHGLQLLLDTQYDEYKKTDLKSITAGFYIKVHSAGFTPSMSGSSGVIEISPGFHTSIGFKITQVHNMEPPWGDCNSSNELALYKNMAYSEDLCYQECIIQELSKRCGCVPYYIDLSEINDHDFYICNTSQRLLCIIPETEEVERGLSGLCKCRPGCIEISYHPTASQSVIHEDKIPAIARKYIHRNFTSSYNDLNYVRKTITAVSLFYDTMYVETITQKKAIDESSILGEIGGLMGLFIGFSVLTVIEVIEACLFAVASRIKINRSLDVLPATIMNS